ncbi:MAG TPA: hypothetical protein VMV92_04775 [Streptosporangiaceae bacterium]|nr:hypothetical protein [Streptosporangiaceae bacterium]
MTAGLDALPRQRQADVLAALCALETDSRPLPAASYRALAEPALREVVREMLATAGRVLVETGPGYASGYDDGIADRLAAEGIGVLPPDDRAVLTLVLLFSVAIPRAEGKLAPEAPWTLGRPVPRERLYGAKVPKGVVRAALQRLQDAGITRNVGDSVRPGPSSVGSPRRWAPRSSRSSCCSPTPEDR